MSDRIRKINVSTRSTVAVVAGVTFGASRIQSIDVTSNGTLYAADYNQNVIWKVFESGSVKGVVVGDFSTSAPPYTNSNTLTSDGTDALLKSPIGLAVGRDGGIYFGDGTGFEIRRMTGNGSTFLFAGNATTSGDSSNKIDALTAGTTLFSPSSNGMGLAVDLAGIVYIADTGNHKIKKIWPSGKSTSLAGSTAGFTNATGQAAKFNTPTDCCVDRTGDVIVADKLNNRIRRVSEAGQVFTIAGLAGAGFVNGAGMIAKFSSPVRICADPNSRVYYVMDKGNNAIRRVDEAGNVTTLCNYNPPATGEGDLCMDNSGYLYLLENNS